MRRFFVQATPCRRLRVPLLLVGLGVLAGCSGLPVAPTWSAVPGSTRTVSQFHMDDAYCRAQAEQAVAGRTPDQAAAESTATGAVVGATVGAVAGGLLTDGRNLGAGAATGAVLGTIIGSSESSRSARAVQQRYDQTYYSCMYALGHRVPVSAVAPLPGAPALVAPPPGAPLPVPARSTPPSPPPGQPPAPPRSWQRG
jgi:uncharacterized protein YcfJ